MNASESSTSDAFALIDRMKTELPDVWDRAQVVGKWVWLEFNIPPLPEVRSRLKNLGFHWNGVRKCWQNPCGVSRPGTGADPRQFFPVTSAVAVVAPNTPQAIKDMTKEYKVVTLRECPLPDLLQICDTPDKAAEYWKLTVATNPYFNPDCECFVVLMLNTRRKVKGYQLVSMGTLDTILVHPREVFRAAIISASAAVVIMHNHPSGDPAPSEADIKVTRDLIRAGQLLKIEVLDHVIIGNPNRSSLRELGYFYS